MIIKTERSRLGRILDIVLTALGWVCFLYLLGRGVMTMTGGMSSHAWADMQPFLHTLAVYGLVAVFNGFLLVSWAQYNRLRFARADRRGHLPRLPDMGLMRSFGISREQLARLRESHATVIWHAGDGRIVEIEVHADTVTYLASKADAPVSAIAG